MQRIQLGRPIIRVVGISSILVLSAARCGSEAAGTKSYRDPGGTYSVAYPQTWYLDADAKGFRIYNFPPHRFKRQLVLPDRGAVIAFGGMKVPVKSLEAWIDSDIAFRGVDSRRAFRMRFEHEPSDVQVTETVSHYTTGRVTFEQVDWYFSIQGVLFDAGLEYYRGDPGVEAYRDVLRRVVSSIAVSPHRGPHEGQRD